MGPFHEHDEDEWDAPPRIFFSSTELLHLAVSVIVLSTAFALVLGIRKGEGFTPTFDFSNAPRLLVYSAIVVVPAFILHELAHKIVAQRKDMWAEFRANFVGLGVGLVATAIFGLLLSVPGAVMIYGRGRLEALRDLRDARASGDAGRIQHATIDLKIASRDEGVISIVGPCVNLFLGYGAVLLSPLFKPVRIGAFGSLFQVIVAMNCILAAFNMLPIGPLDGRKVWYWSKLGFIGMWLLIVALAAIFFTSNVSL